MFFLEWLAASRHNKNADLSQQHHFTHSNYFLGIFVLSSVFAVRHWVYFTQKPRKLCLLIGQSKFQPNKKTQMNWMNKNVRLNFQTFSNCVGYVEHMCACKICCATTDYTSTAILLQFVITNLSLLTHSTWFNAKRSSFFSFGSKICWHARGIHRKNTWQKNRIISRRAKGNIIKQKIRIQNRTMYGWR